MAPKRATKKQDPAAKKKSKRDEYDDGDNDFFLGSDDEAKRNAGDESEEEEEHVETAEEKRLRLAREYLNHLRQQEADDHDDRRGVTGGSDEEEEEGDEAGEEDEAITLEDRIADRLKQDAAQAQGRLQRRIAARVHIPSPTDEDYTAPSCSRHGHRLSVTALALSADDSLAFSVSKDGAICKWDVETMKRTSLYRPGDRASAGANASTSSSSADWVKPRDRVGSRGALYAAAVSSDGKYLAVGGGDKKIYVFDAKSGEFIQHYPGHRDVITSLVFREGTHMLLSGSFDRTIKLWSLDDRAYMDTLYGHQAEVLSVDALRAERALSSGHDHTCRVWKIPEESQLIFRAHDRAIDCARYVTGTEWISGGVDGSVHLWSQLKKRPVFTAKRAHGPAAAATYGAPGSAGSAGALQLPLSVEHGWVNSVAVCRGSDLVASGAGDGAVRLWSVTPSKTGGAGALVCKGALPQRGFVNGLAIARSGRFVLAGVGQEPRMGRWARDGGARNGVALHTLRLDAE